MAELPSKNKLRRDLLGHARHLLIQFHAEALFIEAMNLLSTFIVIGPAAR